MLLPTTLALAFAALADEPSAAYVCWAALGPVDGVRRGRVYLEQDEQRRFLRHTVSVETDEFGGLWSIDSLPDRQPEPRPYATFWLPIPEHTSGPVQVTVVADGHAFWSGSRPSNTTTRFDHGQTILVPAVDLRGRPFGTFPSLWGLHRLEISASDGLGNEILRRTVALPDWERIARRARGAERAVDRLARGASCLPATMP